MRRILLALTLIAVMIMPGAGSVGAEEFGSVFVWHAGKNSAGAPQDAIQSKGYFYTFKKGDFINTITIKGYGPYVKRLNIVLQDRKGNVGKHLVRFEKAKKDAKGIHTYTYQVDQKDRWIIARLEYKVNNFSEKNRVYTEPSLFWIEKVNAYQLEPPTNEDDLK